MNQWKKVFFDQIPTYIGILNETLSKDYPTKELGEFVKIAGGFSFKSIEYRESGIPIIRISDFQNEVVVLNNVKYYDENDNLEKYELNPGDIIIALTGGTIGKLAIVQPNLGKIYLNQRVGKFDIIDSDSVSDEYCYWLARGVGGEIKKIAWGGAQPNVSGKQIEKMKFIFPEKEVQNKIVQFLNDLKNKDDEEKIYFNELCENKIINSQNIGFDCNSLSTEITHQQSLLKKLRQAILQEAIEGKLTKDWRKKNPDVESASVLLEKIKAEKAKLIAEKKIKKQKPLPPIEKDEIPFDIPENWVWCRLGEILLLTDNLNIQIKLKSNDYVNYVDIDAINNKTFKIENIKTKPMRELSSRARRVLKKGFILYSTVRPYLNNIAVIEENKDNFIGSTGFVVFKPLILLNEYTFIFLLSRYIRDYYLKLISGFNSPSITNDNFLQTLFPLPPLTEQKAIVKKVEHLYAVCDELETQINDSKANAEMLMQAVLKEAFGN